LVVMSQVANQTAEPGRAPPPSGSGPAEMTMPVLRCGSRITAFGSLAVEFIFVHVDLPFVYNGNAEKHFARNVAGNHFAK
jgi:hypothetical protein